MDIVKHMLTTVSKDRRVLALLIGWGFGAFMEGMAGFGTAIAIPASMLVAMGFDPIKAILVCLVANSVPTTYGSIGIPASTLANLTGIDPVQLSTYISLQLLPLNILCPFIIVAIVGGSLKALKGVFMITLLSLYFYASSALSEPNSSFPDLYRSDYFSQKHHIKCYII